MVDKMAAPMVKWIKINNATGPIPRPRQGHRAVSIRDLIIVYGGGNEGMIDELHVFNIASNQWFVPSVRGDVPPCCASFGFVSYGARIFLFGGMLERGRYSNDLYELNATNWEWKKVKARSSRLCQPPCPRLGHSFTVCGSRIYLFAGLTNTSEDNRSNVIRYLNDFYSLELKSGSSALSWDSPSIVGKFPSVRESHTCVAVEGSSSKLIVYGGFNGIKRLSDVWIYIVDTCSWVEPVVGGQLAVGRSLHTACLLGNMMYVFGGWVHKDYVKRERGDDEENVEEKQEIWRCSDSLQALDLNTMRWLNPRIGGYECLKPKARAGHCAAVVGSRVYIWSGRDEYRKVWNMQVCFKDLWFVETGLPATPTRVRLIRASHNSLEVCWDPVPNAESYLLQIKKYTPPPTTPELSHHTSAGIEGGQIMGRRPTADDLISTGSRKLLHRISEDEQAARQLDSRRLTADSLAMSQHTADAALLTLAAVAGQSESFLGPAVSSDAVAGSLAVSAGTAANLINFESSGGMSMMQTSNTSQPLVRSGVLPSSPLIPTPVQLALTSLMQHSVPLIPSQFSSSFLQQPSAVSQLPVAVSKPSAAVSQPPAAVHQLQAAVSQLPVSMSQLPTAVSQQPSSVSPLPAAGSQLPAIVNQLPAAMTPLQIAMNHLPATINQQPAATSIHAVGLPLPGSTQLRLAGSQLYVAGSQLLSADSQQSSAGLQIRSAGSQLVTTGIQLTPTGPQLVPAGPQLVPAGPQLMPAGPQLVPTGSQRQQRYGIIPSAIPGVVRVPGVGGIVRTPEGAMQPVRPISDVPQQVGMRFAYPAGQKESPAVPASQSQTSISDASSMIRIMRPSAASNAAAMRTVGPGIRLLSPSALLNSGIRIARLTTPGGVTAVTCQSSPQAPPSLRQVIYRAPPISQPSPVSADTTPAARPTIQAANPATVDSSVASPATQAASPATHPQIVMLRRTSAAAGLSPSGTAAAISDSAGGVTEGVRVTTPSPQIVGSSTKSLIIQRPSFTIARSPAPVSASPLTATSPLMAAALSGAATPLQAASLPLAAAAATPPTSTVAATTPTLPNAVRILRPGAGTVVMNPGSVPARPPYIVLGSGTGGAAPRLIRMPAGIRLFSQVRASAVSNSPSPTGQPLQVIRLLGSAAANTAGEPNPITAVNQSSSATTSANQVLSSSLTTPADSLPQVDGPLPLSPDECWSSDDSNSVIQASTNVDYKDCVSTRLSDELIVQMSQCDDVYNDSEVADILQPLGDVGNNANYGNFADEMLYSPVPQYDGVGDDENKEDDDEGMEVEVDVEDQKEVKQEQEHCDVAQAVSDTDVVEIKSEEAGSEKSVKSNQLTLQISSASDAYDLKPSPDALSTLASAAVSLSMSADSFKQTEPEKSQPEKCEKSKESMREKLLAEGLISTESCWCNVGIFRDTSHVITSYDVVKLGNRKKSLKQNDDEEEDDDDDDDDCLTNYSTASKDVLTRQYLEPGGAYKIRVAALNSYGRGRFSLVAAFSTMVPGLPDAPINVSISSGPDSVMITWNPPRNPCGTVLDYAVDLLTDNPSTAPAITLTRVYFGRETRCSIPSNCLRIMHVDYTDPTKPTRVLRVSCRNERGFGPAVQVRWRVPANESGISQQMSQAGAVSKRSLSNEGISHMKRPRPGI